MTASLYSPSCAGVTPCPAGIHGSGGGFVPVRIVVLQSVYGRAELAVRQDGQPGGLTFGVRVDTVCALLVAQVTRESHGHDCASEAKAHVYIQLRTRRTRPRTATAAHHLVRLPVLSNNL